MSSATLFTLGHSNRTLEEFFALLHQQNICQLVDIRSLPQSRHNPSYNRNTLSLACEDEGIAYAWLGHELGGLRNEKPGSRHCALTNSSFRGFADYMASPLFATAIERLATLAHAQPTAIMCAEREPSQCHRGLIADYLSLRGWQIVHLLTPQQISRHIFNPLARRENDLPIYDQLDQEQLNLKF